MSAHPSGGEVQPPAASELLASGEALALDVREHDEWRAGRIAGSLHIPLGELGERLAELPRDRRILAVCRSGTRSAAVTHALHGRGYDVLNLAGGLVSWRAHGLPLETAQGTVT